MDSIPNDVYVRLSTLEANLAALYQRLDIAMPGPPSASTGVPPEVVELARAGKTIEAIKRYREFAGCDLAYAKHVVDSL